MTWSADVFHVGPQKTGTTWVYRCLCEHPEISTSDIDAIHYYSILYHKGGDWYRRQFSSSGAEKIFFDPTPNYFRSPFVPERIANDNPQAKIIICIREPIERAFSHYWHEKKKNRFNYSFGEIFDNFDLFTNWIEPGLYSVHIERFLQYFPQEQMKVMLFDDLDRDPAGFIREIYLFSGVTADFVPSVVDKKVNVARPRQSSAKRSLHKLRLHKPAKAAAAWIAKLSNSWVPGESSYMETLDDVSSTIMGQLCEMIEPELSKLEKLLELDLSIWKNRYDGRLSNDS